MSRQKNTPTGDSPDKRDQLGVAVLECGGVYIDFLFDV